MGAGSWYVGDIDGQLMLTHGVVVAVAIDDWYLR
jgi:hypothetical protein